MRVCVCVCVRSTSVCVEQFVVSSVNAPAFVIILGIHWAKVYE